MDFDVQHRDCFDSLAAMRDAGGCDLILTSPPYPDARKPEAYGAEFDTTLEGYHRLGEAVFEALKPGGVCALNIDGPVRKWRKVNKRGEEVGSERSLIAFEVALDWAREIGFRYVERCVYGRESVPGSHGPRWRSGGELVHVFSRPGARPYFDASAFLTAAKTQGLVTGVKSHRTKRGFEGKSENKRPYGAQGSTRGVTTIMNCGIPTASTDNDHEAPFSRHLADAYVLCYSPPGGLVGDPFVGSGTVAFSCHRHGRRFIGGDLGVRQTHKGKPCGRRWADIVNDGLRQTRLFA